MPNDKTLLELHTISQRYGNKTVVHDVSFNLNRGDIGCLLGPSGCGKTTALRCIAGFEHVDSGTIVLANRIIAGKGIHIPAEKRHIGMVFQDYALFPHLTAEENIAFGIQHMSRNQRRKRVDEMLELVQLREFAKIYPHELSGGQQQRISLVRALAPRPKLLLLDEPFSNLDVALRERLCADVRDILKLEQATAILVTHDQNEAFMIADYVGVMNHGVIQQWDASYNLYHRPKNRFIASFIGEGVFLPGVVINDHRVAIELGVIEGEFESPSPVGTNVDVLLRPDDIIHDDDSPLKANVCAKAFRGAQILYTLRLPSGAEMLSLVPSHHNHNIGEPIGIRLASDHIIAFENEPTSSTT